MWNLNKQITITKNKFIDRAECWLPEAWAGGWTKCVKAVKRYRLPVIR